MGEPEGLRHRLEDECARLILSMNIEDLQPGRELDALVAEKVMGWHVEIVQYPHATADFPNYVGRDGIGRCLPSQWNPSTEIASAWLVVEKLSESSIMLSVSWHAGHWWCVIYPEQEPLTEGPYSETAPLAICRAALLSVQPT